MAACGQLRRPDQPEALAAVRRVRPQWKWKPAVQQRISSQRQIIVALRTKLALNPTVRSGREPVVRGAEAERRLRVESTSSM